MASYHVFLPQKHFFSTYRSSFKNLEHHHHEQANNLWKTYRHPSPSLLWGKIDISNEFVSNLAPWFQNVEFKMLLLLWLIGPIDSCWKHKTPLYSSLFIVYIFRLSFSSCFLRGPRHHDSINPPPLWGFPPHSPLGTFGKWKWQYESYRSIWQIISTLSLCWARAISRSCTFCWRAGWETLFGPHTIASQSTGQNGGFRVSFSPSRGPSI